jgi:hypothetical protein
VSEFTVASSDERVLAGGDYLLGVAELLVIVLALGLGARSLREAALPGWRGTPGLLVDVVVGITALVLVSEALGTFGAFGEWEVIAACVVFGAAALLIRRRMERGRDRVPPGPPAPPQGSLATTVAIVGVAGVAAAWAIPTLGSLAAGMDRADTLWYHMPLAAKFVQTGSLGDIFYFDPIFFASFYPSNSEILHAVPILAFERDIVSPLLNLGFLAIGLLASWCIGRPYGVAPLSLIGGSVALGSQMLVEFQAGEALNDITGVAFVLAAVAVLVNGYAASQRGALSSPTTLPAKRGRGGPGDAPRPLMVRAIAVAGLAAGLAAGTKLSFLAPVAALAVGVVVIAPHGFRMRAGAAFALPAALAGIYWYVRNAVATGNPIPYVSSIGPIDLPAPERGFELRPGFSLSHYWNDLAIWSDWFSPGLAESFGVLWPLTLIAMAAGALWALSARADPVLRMLGALVLFTAIAYLFTPLTAAGEEGEPIAFEWNVRYIAPAVAVGLAALPCLPALRSTPRSRGLTLLGLAVLLAATVASLVQWDQGHTKGAIATAACVLVLAAAHAWLRSRGHLGPAARRRSLVAVALVALAGAIAAGWLEQRHYLERRFENTSPRLGLADALRWGRDVRDATIAVSGIRGVFNQFPFYGADLSNEVQWLGIRGEHHAWLRIPTCERWREKVNEGGFTHVVTTYDPFDPDILTDTKEGLWTRRDDASETILRDGPVSVFEIEGEMDPDGCKGLPRLSPAELTGESVNANPRANQP